MATERCPACGKSMRDGSCTDEEGCGFVAGPGLRLVKPAVDSPHPPTPVISPPLARRRIPGGPPNATERQVGKSRLVEARRVLEAHPGPQISERSRLEHLAKNATTQQARRAAADVLAEIEAHEASGS